MVRLRVNRGSLPLTIRHEALNHEGQQALGRKGDGDWPRPSLQVTRPQGIFSYLEHKLVEVSFEAAEGWQMALHLNKRKLVAQGWRAWGKPGSGGL